MLYPNGYAMLAVAYPQEGFTMHPRYEHSEVRRIFDEDARSATFRRIEIDYLYARGLKDVARELEGFPSPSAHSVQNREAEFGHDVVAWLAEWMDSMPQSLKRHIHQGLTSSDLVDNWLFRSVSAVHDLLTRAVDGLYDATMTTTQTPRLGRTHGQYAEPTTWEHRMAVWRDTIYTNQQHFRNASIFVKVLKTPGATGRSLLLGDVVWKFRSQHAPGTVVRRNTQVIPRTNLLSWAGAVLPILMTCEDIALQVRLGARSEVAELAEGNASKRHGSSAMPGKRNPIQSEQISGFVRLARGAFSALAENCALHDDRDISNSSVERVALVDFCHLAATIIERTTEILVGLQVDRDQMKDNIAKAGTRPFVSAYQFAVQEFGADEWADPISASRVVEWWLSPQSTSTLAEAAMVPENKREEFYSMLLAFEFNASKGI